MKKTLNGPKERVYDETVALVRTEPRIEDLKRDREHIRKKLERALYEIEGQGQAEDCQ